MFIIMFRSIYTRALKISKIFYDQFGMFVYKIDDWIKFLLAKSSVLNTINVISENTICESATLLNY